MLHPIYDTPGMFEFTVDNNMLIVNNRDEYFEYGYDTCFLKLKKKSELILTIDDVDYRFQKHEPKKKVLTLKRYTLKWSLALVPVRFLR
ncbi:hypothetical protein GCM10009119_29630 [Algoriphagus jejuensis]|uniref:Uncharacterized protein n=2 Tax=Algoriphagus jejuensis TaxID=419934 RepID=A0ABP3YFU2_9BACT